MHDYEDDQPSFAPVGLSYVVFFLSLGAGVLWAIAAFTLGSSGGFACAGMAAAVNLAGLLLSVATFAGCTRRQSLTRDWQNALGLAASVAAFGINFLFCVLAVVAFALRSYLVPGSNTVHPL